MAGISSADLARELLGCCVAGKPWPRRLLRPLLERAVSDQPAVALEASRALFVTVIERLNDLFEPRLCDIYAALMAEVLEFAGCGYNVTQLLTRYQRIRQPRRCTAEPRAVYVLSRVTLGADVAVTSIVLDAVKRRFPDASVWLVGPEKNYELFAEDSRVSSWPTRYLRAGTLRERLENRPWFETEGGRAIVVDPDSRLTQLGLLRVCPDDEHYFFFESRSHGADTCDPLPVITARWCEETFGVSGARAYIAPCPLAGYDPDVTVSFGVGENLEKRVPDLFERGVLELLGNRSVMVDTGSGGEEAQRVEHAIRGLHHVRTWHGAYAPFASLISQSNLYIGYDSAGQHVAAACGVPLVSIFAGYPCERFYQRWRPAGPGPIDVIKVGDSNPEVVLAQVRSAVAGLCV
ncbi:MAG: hypothetical protein HYZ57_19465 [Acidobacteria bacterium]|nr:hypothetical protein [Acidobacteriota bacterium]